MKSINSDIYFLTSSAARKTTDELFVCIQPQLQIDRSSPMYTACHMQYHLHSYGMKNEKELSKNIRGCLTKAQFGSQYIFSKDVLLYHMWLRDNTIAFVTNDEC